MIQLVLVYAAVFEGARASLVCQLIIVRPDILLYWLFVFVFIQYL
jgi:hypothetical protein